MKQQELATTIRRVFGYLIDVFVISIPLSYGMILVFGVDKAQVFTAKYGALIFLLYLVISITLWAGKTVGKNLLKLRVVRLDGQKIDAWTAIKRYIIAGVVYGLSLGIGMWVSLFMMIFRKDKRTIHDFIAGTMVVQE
ncbi:MAG: RDD family protein [Bacillaceae bacterium]